MGTCKLWAGDRRESVIGYRSMGAKASSGGDGLSNYPGGCPGCRGGGGGQRAGIGIWTGTPSWPGKDGLGVLPFGAGPRRGALGRSRRIARVGTFLSSRLERGCIPPRPPLRFPPDGRRPAARPPRSCPGSGMLPGCRHLLAPPAPNRETRTRSYHPPLVYSSRSRAEQRLFLLQLSPNFSALPSGRRCPRSPRPLRFSG